MAVSFELKLVLLLGITGHGILGFDLREPDLTVPDSSLSDIYKELHTVQEKRKGLERHVVELETQLLQRMYDVAKLRNTSRQLTLITHFKRPTEPVAFEGTLDSDITGHGMSVVVPFHNVITNALWAYSSTDNSFHCNHDGIYLLAITLYANAPDHECSVDIYWNGVVVARPFVDRTGAPVATSEVAVVSTRKGDQIRVKWGYYNTCVLKKDTRFSAVLIKDMDN